MARPKVKIDLSELEKLCGLQCTDEEIAAFFGVSTRTIERRRKITRFSEVMDRAKAKGRVSVRRSRARTHVLVSGVSTPRRNFVRNELGLWLWADQQRTGTWDNFGASAWDSVSTRWLARRDRA